ncbi:hypothetical protein KC316_g14306 [Hortaea werneckii]|nr:hypothetical protein KC316_g14306 [Hortaea werneckii]
MDTTEGFPQSRQNDKYSNHSALNALDYYIPRRPSTAAHQLWMIYIHGGAWRDPEIDSTSFTQAQNLLLQSREIDQIAGFASINYRLSPYPSHPQSPSDPSDPARNAHHPDHLNDILDALRHLQDAFSFGTRYLLVGHSCGATLAFQVAMMQHQQQSKSSPLTAPVPPPLALLAVEGLYDLPALVAYHSDSPIYQHLITNAFGPDPEDWARASPTTLSTSTQVPHQQHTDWPKLIVLAHSRQDELVEWQQVDLMHAALKKSGRFDELQLTMISMSRILNPHQIPALLHMVDPAELGVHLFQQDFLRLGHEEVDEGREQEVDACEHVEGVEAAVLEMGVVSAEEEDEEEEEEGGE